MSPTFHARCVAPPLTDDILSECPKLADECVGPVRVAMNDLLLLVEQAKSGMQVTLPDNEARAAYGALFDQLPPGQRKIGVKECTTADGRKYFKDDYEVTDARAKKRKDVAFHLLWYVGELAVGRHPG